MGIQTIFGLPGCDSASADFRILPAAFDGTVSYGRGTAEGPEAIIAASAQVELWDDETGTDLEGFRYHTAPVQRPQGGESARDFLRRLEQRAVSLQHSAGLTIGIGGEHSITPACVRASAGSRLSDVTVVQFDAHTDLRDEYESTPHSHACAMRRLVDAGARLISIGVRALCAEEAKFVARQEAISLYRAQDLFHELQLKVQLDRQLRALSGRIYVTIDVDVLACQLCPATGTPEPGGLEWWEFLSLLKTALQPRADVKLIGCDVVETVPMPHSQVNEFTAARIAGKIVAYSTLKRTRRLGRSV